MAYLKTLPQQLTTEPKQPQATLPSASATATATLPNTSVKIYGFPNQFVMGIWYSFLGGKVVRA
jgi:hypothetical protein